MAIAGPRHLAAAAVLLTLAASGYPNAQAPESVQTLCVLDFQRVGDDARSDWLGLGLADLMIGTMSTVSPYLVIERRHLRTILEEQRFAASGLVDADAAVRTARLARAELLLQGSFVRQADQLTIQARLIHVSDQRVIAQATWVGPDGDILLAPRALAAELLGSGARPQDVAKVPGIEHLFPTSIDEARSYYLGVRAFDDGQYAEALAHYLDSSRRARVAGKAHPAVLEMYYLLDRSEHAVLFARDLARSFELRRDRPAAIEYYFVAARESLGPLNDARSARTLLNKVLTLVDAHDRATGDIARTKRAVLGRMDVLNRSGSRDAQRLLSDRELRHQVWVGDIEAELASRADEQARGGFAVLEAGAWVKRSVPPPTLLMWKIRALGELARANAELGEIRQALDRYEELLEEYAFLTSRLPPDSRLLTSLKTEAHFMMLRHYAATAQLIRHHPLNRINRLNLVSNNEVFSRNVRDPGPDARARVASRFQGRGNEYFDFAALSGHQIDSITLRATVRGMAQLSIDLPQPSGRPPRYSLSRRVARFELPPGSHTRTTVLPAGTEFVSLSSGWDTRDIFSWDITFSVSRKRARSETASGAEAPIEPAVQQVIDRYSAGWERSLVVRDAQSAVYSGNPRLDVYGEDWLACSLDGDLRIFNQRDLRLEAGLPITINTREREFDPSLVRTHDGRYALLWARGTGRTNATRFVSFSEDLVRWESPQRLVFENPRETVRYTYSQSEPLERTFNIAALRRGYAMLLAQGFVRRSDDLRTWGPPRKELPQDLDRNRLIRGGDGTVWAVYETSSPERQPYTDRDWLSGFFVIDGTRHRHVSELRVSRTLDGSAWQDAGGLTVSGQPGALWAFAIDEGRIGIGLGFNNLNTKWFAVSPFDGLSELDVQLPFMQQSDDGAFFVQDAMLTGVRPVLDPAKQKLMLLATTTSRLSKGLAR